MSEDEAVTCQNAQGQTGGMPTFAQHQTEGLLPYGQTPEGLRRMQVAPAISILTEAARIRRDPALMAEIRAEVRRQRDDLASFLDDIGEGK